MDDEKASRMHPAESRRKGPAPVLAKLQAAIGMKWLGIPFAASRPSVNGTAGQPGLIASFQFPAARFYNDVRAKISVCSHPCEGRRKG
jgi:hypothetical protein